VPNSGFVVGRKNLNHISPHPERPAPKIDIVALVENLHQPPQNVLAADALPFFQKQQHAVIRLGRTKAVDAAHRTHNDRVPPLKKRAGCRQPQLVQFLVDGRFLLDVQVAGGDIRFRLVVVVVTHEIFDSVAGEELLELVIKLRGKRLVMRQNQRRPLRLLDDLGHGEGLARAGHAQQHLVLLARGQALHQLGDSAGLIPARLVGGHQLKVHAKYYTAEAKN